MTTVLRLRGWAIMMTGAIWLGLLSGCVGDMPHGGSWSTLSKPAAAQSASNVPGDYLYFPSYGVYFDSTRQHYVYLLSDGWVTRSAPAGVTVATLLASPMVRLNLLGGPGQHHASVTGNYPKNWPGTGIALAASDPHY